MTTTEDTTFNAEYVELVWGEADSVQRRLEQLAADYRTSARHHRAAGNDAIADAFNGQAAAFTQAVSMLDLAFEQALARVARQVTA